MVESEKFLTFVKYPAPQRPRQVVIPVFRDMIDKEFHRDQIEGFGPSLIKLTQKQKRAPPISTLVTQSTPKRKETATDSPR
jgi:hypothetical protein